MATGTLQRNKEKTGEWSSIFPTEQVTEQQSALYVKKLLAVAISSISYLRAIFPEHAFGDRCLEDLNLKILRDDSACPGACQVIKWVKGCFDALDKKYLRQLIIGIYLDPEHPDTVIESYCFKFCYAQNGGIDIYRNNKKITEAHSSGETKKATIRLLRTILLLTQTLQSLPEDALMTMKLLYYDEVTPSDYEPPGFKAADSDVFRFEEEPMNIKVGDVATPFHTVKLRIKTDAKQFTVQEDGMEQADTVTDEQGTSQVAEGLDQEDEPFVQNTRETVPQQNEFCLEEAIMPEDYQVSSGGGEQRVPEPVQCEVTPQETPNRPGETAIQLPNSQLSVTSQEDYGVKCPCGCNEDDGLMILCAKCHFWQHGICFKILEETEAPDLHYCDLCGDPDSDSNHPTDPSLHGMEEVPKQAMCLWRRSLLACTESNRINAPNLARRLGVEMTVAQGLMNRLTTEGYLKEAAKGKRFGKIVNKAKLKNEGFKKYFKKDNQQLENMDEEGRPAATPQQSSIEEQVNGLADMAEDINISGRRRKGRKPSSKAKANEAKSDPRPSPNQDSVQTVPVSKGKKRARPNSSQDLHFDVSDSQDMSQEFKPSKKRKKASIVQKSVPV